MTENLQKRFSKYGRKHGLHIQVKRIALTMQQVRKYKLPPNVTKRKDTRSPKYVAKYGDRCWEVDAIPPEELQRLVTQAIEEHIDGGTWNADLQREIRDKADLEARFRNAQVNI
jgi:hypothetical protein